MNGVRTWLSYHCEFTFLYHLSWRLFFLSAFYFSHLLICFLRLRFFILFINSLDSFCIPFDSATEFRIYSKIIPFVNTRV